VTIQRACFYCGDVFRVIEHPVIASWTDRLRSVDTDTDEFRRLLRQIGQLLVPSATEHLPTREITVHTPLAETTGRQLDGDTPVLVSILRAGNGLLDGALQVLSDADVGFIGLARDHESLEAIEYLVNLPRLANRHVIVVDPMLATGHSAVAALNRVAQQDPASVTLMCVVAAPEGVQHLTSHHPEVRIVTAALDEQLNDSGYILPGLGDAGDRLYGT
jgi:uracil phosphoribosyltransferase|tara:strand:+ start:716 stop:1369 length:654 start_codon:yes stop_codon:yes gene_type:complete